MQCVNRCTLLLKLVVDQSKENEMNFFKKNFKNHVTTGKKYSLKAFSFKGIEM